MCRCLLLTQSGHSSAIDSGVDAGLDREQEKAAHDQRQGPNQIKIDPSVPQESDTDPLVYDDGDDTDCHQYRSGVNAEYGNGD